MIKCPSGALSAASVAQTNSASTSHATAAAADDDFSTFAVNLFGSATL